MFAINIIVATSQVSAIILLPGSGMANCPVPLMRWTVQLDELFVVLCFDIRSSTVKSVTLGMPKKPFEGVFPKR